MLNSHNGSLAPQNAFTGRTITHGRAAAVQHFFYLLSFATRGLTGVIAWENIPGVKTAVILHRALLVLSSREVLPAHRREPRPQWCTAIHLLLRCLSSEPLSDLANMMFAWSRHAVVHRGPRRCDITGFSAGSYAGLAIEWILRRRGLGFEGLTKVGAIACPPSLLNLKVTISRSLTLVQLGTDCQIGRAHV